MVQALTRRFSFQSSRSFHISKAMLENAENGDESPQSRSVDIKNAEDQSMEQQSVGESRPGTPTNGRHHHQSDMDMMKERFAKLLLGEDMSGGGKGVSSALALSNAVTNLAASIFGEQGKLAPLAPDRKARWKREMDWLLSVTDHIVEFVPSQQKSKDGTNMEIMVTKQRADLLVNIPGLRKLDTMLIDTLDNFGQEKEFWYVSKNDNPDNDGGQRDDKWWHPIVKVPPNGLSEASRRWLQKQKESVNQVLKAAMAINANILSEMEIPESYIDSLPKNGRASLGDSIYKSITVEYFDPGQFLTTMDLSTEHKVLDLKNRIEASIIIWKRKMNMKDTRSSWGSGVSLEKRELFEERAETILLLLKQHFPGLPQSSLDISKIQYNRDIGHALLESYSRILESLAYTVMSRIEDVLHADSLTQTSSSPAKSEMSSNVDDDGLPRMSVSDAPTLSDFMGWDMGARSPGSENGDTPYSRCDSDKKLSKPPLSPTPKVTSYLEKLENLSGLKSPTAQG